MKLYIRQKVFSWNDKFTVKDEMGQDRYYVEGEIFSFGKRLHLYHMDGSEAAFIKQKVLSWLPKYTVFCGDRQVAEIKKEFTFLFPKYTIAGLGWEVNGDFISHNYQISQNGRPIVSISKAWMSWGDAYELDVEDPQNQVLALAVVLAIDCVMDSQSSATVSVSN